jgi:hypothetical protein
LIGKTMSPVAALMQISTKGAYPFGQICRALSSAEAVLAYASTDIPIVTAIFDRIALLQQTYATDSAKFAGTDGTVCVQSAGVSIYGTNAASDPSQIWKCLRVSMGDRLLRLVI